MRKTLLLIFALCAAVGSWASDELLTLDFTTQDTEETAIPKGTANTAVSGDYTWNGYSVTVASACWNSKYLFLVGGSSSITLPKLDATVEKIVVSFNKSGSTANTLNIKVDETEVSTGANPTNDGETDVTFEIASDYQTAGTYTLAVTAGSKNTQVTSIVVYGTATADEEVVEEGLLPYTFVCTDWTSPDEGRVAASSFVYDTEANTITLAATGANNIALGQYLYQSGTDNAGNGKYYVNAEQTYFVIVGEGLSTEEGASYLWWLNGANNWGSVAATRMVERDNGDVIVMWDVTRTGLNTYLLEEQNELCGWTALGLTSANEDGKAVIKDISFYTPEDAIAAYAELDVEEEVVELLPYTFVCNEWTSPDEGRVASDSFVYDEEANTITLAVTGANNVALGQFVGVTNHASNQGKGKYYVTNEQTQFTILASGVSTEEGASYLWWLNGANNGSVAPTTVVTREDGDVILVWDVVAGGFDANMQNEQNELCGWTAVGLTSAAEDGTAIIKDISYYTAAELMAAYTELAPFEPIDMTELAQAAEWTGATGTFGSGSERYSDTESYNATLTYDEDGELISSEANPILYQTLTDLPQGNYEVQFYAAANSANWKAYHKRGSGIAQIFANETVRDINVVRQTSCTITDYLRTLVCTVGEDGTLTYGIQNIAEGGNWYVAQTVAVIYYGDETPEAVSDDSEETIPTVELAEGFYMLENVATASYLGADNSWGTQASLVSRPAQWYITPMGDGDYTLKSLNGSSSTATFLGTNLYVDSSVAYWYLQDNGDGTLALYNSTAGGYLASADGTTAATAVSEVTDAAAWVLFTQDDIKAAMALTTETVDVTGLIMNPCVNYNSNYLTKYWTTASYDRTASAGSATVGSRYGNVCGYGIIESWKSSNGFDIYQEITGLPAGTYQFTAHGLRNDYDGNGENLPVLYANDSEVELPSVEFDEDGNPKIASIATAYAAFTSTVDSVNNYAIDPVTVTIAEGDTLTIGFKSASTNMWAIIGELNLYYVPTAPVDITSTVDDTWVGATGTYSTGSERYSATTSFDANEDGTAQKMLYQSLSGLTAGNYLVQFYAAASSANWSALHNHGAGIAQLFANDQTIDINVLKQSSCDLTDYLRTIVCTVGDDGVLEYGIQNVAEGGNWYVAQTAKVVWYGDQTPDVTTDADEEPVYMPNPELAEIAEGDYLLYNEATQCYMGGGLWWGTAATAIGKPQWFTIEATDGGYTLDSHQHNSASQHYLSTGMYVDSDATAWNISQNEDGTYSLYAHVLAFDGYVAATAVQTQLSAADEVNASSKWQLISKADFVASLAAATEDEPVDATAYILSPELKRNSNTTYYPTWTVTGYNAEDACGNYAFGSGGSAASCAESYHSATGFMFSQELTGLKPGYYTLAAQGFYRNDYTDGTEPQAPVMFVDEQESAFSELETSDIASMATAYQAFLTESYPVEAIAFTVSSDEDTVTIGFKGADTGLWNIMGELTLMYLGGEDIATGVTAVTAPAPAGIYTVAGQKVAKATKGLYIINGQKVLK